MTKFQNDSQAAWTDDQAVDFLMSENAKEAAAAMGHFAVGDPQTLLQAGLSENSRGPWWTRVVHKSTSLLTSMF